MLIAISLTYREEYSEPSPFDSLRWVPGYLIRFVGSSQVFYGIIKPNIAKTGLHSVQGNASSTLDI